MMIEALILTAVLSQQGFIPLRRADAGGCAGEDFTDDADLELLLTMETEWTDTSGNGDDFTETGTVTQETTTVAEGSNSLDPNCATQNCVNYISIDEGDLVTTNPFSNSASTTGDYLVVFRVHPVDDDVSASKWLIWTAEGSSDGVFSGFNGSTITWCGGVACSTSTTTITTGSWWHVALRYTSADTADEMSILIDGVEEDSDNADSHGVCESAESECLRLPQDVNTLNGFLDEVAVFSGSRTDAQILDMATNGLDGCGLP